MSMFRLSLGMRASRTQQAPSTNSTMAHTTLMQQESCTTWSAWSRSQLCISSCRAAGGNADQCTMFCFTKFSKFCGFMLVHVVVVQVWLCRQTVPLGGSSLAGSHGESSWRQRAHPGVLLLPRIPAEHEWWGRLYLCKLAVRMEMNLLCFIVRCKDDMLLIYKVKEPNASLLRDCCFRLRPGTFADISGPSDRCSAASLGHIKRRLHQEAQESPGEST